MRLYAEIVELAGGDPSSVTGFLAEELLSGDEVTLEGYVHGGRVTDVGVTDSVKYPGTLSFERFEYPSALPEERQAELVDVAARVLPGARVRRRLLQRRVHRPGRGPGADHRGQRAHRLAVRPAASQALHGRSSYDALFQLALGEDPGWAVGPPDGVARELCAPNASRTPSSRPCPSPSPISRSSSGPGRRLSEQGVNDSQSYRLAIFTAFGETREEAVARAAARGPRALSFRLAPAPVR